MKSRLARLLMLLLAAAVLTTASDAFAKGKKKNNNNNNNQQQQRQNKLRSLQAKESALRREIAMLETRIPQAQAMLQQAQQQLGTAASGVTSGRSEADAAKSDIALLTEDIASIELHAEQSQPKDSAWAEAKVRYDKAKYDCDLLIERIIDSSAYREVLRRIESSPERGRLMAELRKSYVDDSIEVQNARNLVKITSAACEQAKRDVLANNDKWIKATEELRRVRQQTTAASSTLDNTARQQIAAQHAIKRLQQGLATMQWALQKDRSDLASVERQKKSLQSQGGNNKR